MNPERKPVHIELVAAHDFGGVEWCAFGYLRGSLVAMAQHPDRGAAAADLAARFRASRSNPDR